MVDCLHIVHPNVKNPVSEICFIAWALQNNWEATLLATMKWMFIYWDRSFQINSFFFFLSLQFWDMLLYLTSPGLNGPPIIYRLMPMMLVYLHHLDTWYQKKLLMLSLSKYLLFFIKNSSFLILWLICLS